MTATTARRHPVRGALYGIVLGLGLALVAIGRKLVTLDSIMPLVIVVVGIVIGVSWSMLGPAKNPKAPAPPEASADGAD